MYRETEHLEHYFPTKEEFARLDELWESGALNRHIDNLIDFAKTHRQQIVDLAGPNPDLRMLLLTTKRQIVKIGSVNHRIEISDQVRAIHDEIWIRGEKGFYDRAKIQEEWTDQHAKNWRRWRIKEYIYLIEHCGEKLKSIFFLDDKSDKPSL